LKKQFVNSKQPKSITQKMAFSLLTPLSISTKAKTSNAKYDSQLIDWNYLSHLYEEYQTAKNKEIWAYKSVDISAISWFAPYALIHRVNQDTSGQFGRNKTTPDDCVRFARNWSYSQISETFVDVSHTISKTHNFSMEWINKRHTEWITELGHRVASLDEKHNTSLSKVIVAMTYYILADTSIIILADKSVDIKQIDKMVYYLPAGDKMNSIGSNSRNMLGKTGFIEFRKPSQMRQQVVQIRCQKPLDGSRVYMHPILYENWYSSGITNLGYPSTPLNGYTEFIAERIVSIPELRIKLRSECCHHCAQPKGNSFDYYDRLCWDCGLHAWKIRHKHADLCHLRMCITGCRHTVGLSATLRALRQGAFVLGTTRFPNLALAAYKLEPDYKTWQARLVIIGADFTKYQDIQTVIGALAEYRINCYINNAFQTMPNTPDYLAQARQLELASPANQDELKCLLDCNGNIRPFAITAGLDDSTEDKANKINPSITTNATEFNELAVVQHRFGTGNSWKQPISRIAPEEIITAGMVNQIAPGLIISAFRQLELEPYAATDTKLFPYQIIINVGSSEGDTGVQASITGGHKNHMRKIIECLRAEKDPNLIAYTSDPGFITGVFGKSEPSDRVPGTGLIKVLTADDGGARVLWPLIDFVNSGKRPDEYYRG
jgi:NAD(P)-dependent dehydrogenase (short-subunit alcohol dehydrogenase family)